MSSLPLARVAMALPIRQTFVYRVPEPLLDSVVPGVQIQASFRGRPRRGFVVALEPDAGREGVRDLDAVLEETPLSAHLMALCAWVADYYVAPLGEVLGAALPGGFEGFARSRARRSAALDPVAPNALPERIVPTPEQRLAAERIEAAIAAAAFAPILLHGVTASGKTEIYLQAARAARERGRQTLVLVPEVALSAQVLASFRKRFGARVVTLHSYLGVGERRRSWELARRGAVDVVVGARSAVFAPLPALGLIVVDEEHEPAYKQSEQLRYHGRDTAVRRAQMLGIPIVLGSATPSLETRANAARGKYDRIELPHRIDRRPMPDVRIVDLRRAPASATMLSPSLLESLHERLERGEQAVLFLNRRGHYHHSQCRACGWVPECPECDIALVLHAAPPTWRCHYCDFQRPFVPRCTSCGAELMRYSGAGTQRVERDLVDALPGARVLRLDTDVARKKGAPAAVLERFAAGEADVLIGTQMVAKGLDFPRVTLVGVLDADVGLHLPDFRAAERTFQLLVQVSGRAGRGPRPGEVLIQTATPDHPAVAAAAARDERAFVAYELEHRRDAGYPPFARLAALFFSGKDGAQVEKAAELAAMNVRAREGAGSVAVLGPAPQTIARRRGLHRWHVLLKSERASDLRAAILLALESVEGAREVRGVRVTPDVDPVDVI